MSCTFLTVLKRSRGEVGFITISIPSAINPVSVNLSAVQPLRNKAFFLTNTGMFAMFRCVVIKQFSDQDARISTIYYSGTGSLSYDFLVGPHSTWSLTTRMWATRMWATRTRLRWNRRHRAGSRCGSVSSRRFVATVTGWTIVSMVTAAIRRHMVTRSPATVDNIGRFIVNRPNTPIVIVSTSWNAAGQHNRQRTDHQGNR